MSTVVAVEYLSLDGIMEEPQWSRPYFNEELQDFQLNNLMGSDALLLGRVTYEGFKEAWPSMSDPAGFADKMNGMQKYVVSSTLEQPDWNNSTVIGGDVPAEIAKLKQGSGGDILVAGSARLVQTLHAHGLVDEYRLMVFPTVLGAGKRLFSEGGEATALEVVEARPAGEVVIMILRPRAD